MSRKFYGEGYSNKGHDVAAKVLMRAKWGLTQVELVQGDITQEVVDAIVNAANPALMGGLGVDGAIHRSGGPSIAEECRQIREDIWPEGMPPGMVAGTRAGLLHAKFIIHTVGPVWKGGKKGETEVLKQCYRNSLRYAKDIRMRSIAFPAISTGIYNYPAAAAAEVALSTVKEFLETEGRRLSDLASIDLVRFVLYNDEVISAWTQAFSVYK